MINSSARMKITAILTAALVGLFVPEAQSHELPARRKTLNDFRNLPHSEETSMNLSSPREPPPFDQLKMQFKRKMCLDAMAIVSLSKANAYLIPHNRLADGKLKPMHFRKTDDDEFTLILTENDCLVTITVRIE